MILLGYQAYHISFTTYWDSGWHTKASCDWWCGGRCASDDASMKSKGVFCIVQFTSVATTSNYITETQDCPRRILIWEQWEASTKCCACLAFSPRCLYRREQYGLLWSISEQIASFRKRKKQEDERELILCLNMTFAHDIYISLFDARPRPSPAQVSSGEHRTNSRMFCMHKCTFQVPGESVS